MTEETIQEEVQEETQGEVTEETQSQEEGNKTEESSEQAEKKQGGVQKRINQLTRQIYDQRSQIDNLTGQLSAKPEVKVDEPKKPSPDDFEDQTQYIEALTEFKAEQITDKKLAAQQRQMQRESQQSRQDKIAQNWQAKQQKARNQYEDYDEIVAESNAPITKEMGNAIMDSDKGPDIAYFLGQNPDVAERIASLSPYGQIREIGKLEVKLESGKKEHSSAPAPLTPVKGGAKSSSAAPNDNDSPDEWMRKRNLEVARKKGLIK